MSVRYPDMPPRNPNPPYKRIATEEAWLPKEIKDLYIKGLDDGSINDPGFQSLWGFFGKSTTEKAQAHNRRITSLGEERLADMDAAGIDMAVLALSSPGVQVFEPSQGTALARMANDMLAEGIAANPDRFVGLAAFSPLDIGEAEKELERGVTKLGLRGGILNSHTLGVYLDDEKYWGLFEAAEALDVPIYLHPNTPPADMIDPFLPRCLDAAVYGFACETGLHALRLVVSGLFDRFPKLNIVLGHCGEALPYWLYRIDYMHGHISKTGRHPNVQPLKRRAWDYLIDNFYYTSSGVGWAPPVKYVQEVIGQDRMMYAMDYPWQYVPEEVGVFDHMDVSDAAKKSFYEDVARKVFKI
ncbi:2,3-dihydroxybenzoate decarboxylase [Pseudooceanicola antarcticus]|uniref:2,3-dihydroxybenzoate decarboxylase n=1 Tax=Pseudooceanicola antarcticus TaxID=1247613 RepID=A0A285IXG2_9RHOB|nr:amidohydrolase family protein [Pseudooceanicola antarcticus]PJE25819.1 amidohydrolase [Pseudooceanicola antarcticus]SNY52719.1 2,3-dihydroxybenzoate decarboxylase [Pseudooceanicola antarcticus]